MKILVIVTHPKMKTSKVNKHLMTEANRLEQIDILDLYAEYPNCDIDVKKSKKEYFSTTGLYYNFRFTGILHLHY